MELNFTELDYSNGDPDYNNNTNYEKYWEEIPEAPQDKSKKKKVSFNDILTNMNLVVNNSGVLQFMAPKQSIQNIYEQQQPVYQNENIYQPQQQYAQNIYQQPRHQVPNNKFQQIKKEGVSNEPPIDPSVKHSFIYNKYFKDYQTSTYNPPQVRVPKTIEEYNKMLLEDKIREIAEKKRIDEIKSKKLMFTNNQDPSLNRRNIKPSINNLRKMSFM
jgi:hypothetical protein